MARKRKKRRPSPAYLKAVAEALAPLAPIVEATEEIKPRTLWGSGRKFKPTKVGRRTYVPATVADTPAAQRRLATRRRIAELNRFDLPDLEGWENPLRGGAGFLEETVLGIPASAVALGQATLNLKRQLAPTSTRRRPKPEGTVTFGDIGRAIGEDYAYRWGPLFEGDFTTFLKRGSETGYIPALLDVGLVATAGTSGAVRAGVLKPAAQAVEYRSPGGVGRFREDIKAAQRERRKARRKGDEAGVRAADTEIKRLRREQAQAKRPGADPAAYVKPVRGTELSRRMKAGLAETRKRLPFGWGEHYEFMRHGAHTQIAELKLFTRDRLKLIRREAVKRKMSVDELTASNLRLEFPLRSDLDAYREWVGGLDDAGETLAVLSDPTVLARYADPSEKMLRFEGETRKVVGYHETFYPDEAAATLEQRRYLSSLFARGARFENVTRPLESGEMPATRQNVLVKGKYPGIVLGVEGDTVRVMMLRKRGKMFVREHDVADLEVLTGQQRLVGRTVRERPRTPEEAALRLANLERQWNELISARMEQMMSGKERSAEALKRSRQMLADEAKRRRGEGLSGFERVSPMRPMSYQGEEPLSWDRQLMERHWGYRERGGAVPTGQTLLEELHFEAVQWLVNMAKTSKTPQGAHLRGMLDEMDNLDAGLQKLQGQGMSPAERAIFFEGEEPSGRPDLGTVDELGRQEVSDMIADIRRELEEAGIAEPTYLPHASVDAPVGWAPGGGGLAVPRDPRFQKNRAVLLAMGRVAYDIDALTPRYMKTIRWASYVDRHKDLTAAGIHLDPQNLPADWQKKYDLVRQHLGERMGYTTATASEFRARIAEHFDASDEIELTKGPTQENELTTLNPKEAMTVDGFVIAVPKAYARKIVGEYTKERWALKWLWDKPTDVWRAVVLNLRVGWLVNNIVGNSFLYLLKNAGPQGIAAYARALKRSERGEIFTEDQMMDLFPEQWHGTFGTTQMPSGVAGRITTSNLNPVHWLRRGDIYTERSARLAYLSRQAAKSPEVKAAVKRMQLQGKRWNEVAEDVIKGDPKLAERISDEVNAGLGDYFSMSTFERNAVRRVAPFYAWYKAITKITLALPLDYPGRTMILAKLGQIGAEVDVDDPPWLRGGINLPGGRVLGTQAMNPLTTPVTIGRALGGEDWLSGQQRLGLLHPVFSTLINAQQRRSGGFIENIGREGAEMIRNLPPGRVFFPPERASYEGSAYLREGLGYLGVPIKKPSKELRREGMTPNQRVLADHLEWRKQAVKSAQQYGLLDKKTHRLPKQLQEAVVHRTGRYSAYAGAGLKRGDDDYQQKAFLIDVRTLQRRGAITDAVARKARKWVRSAAKHEIEREREKLSERHFGQGVIYRARLQINRAAFRSLVRELEEDGELTGEQAERAITWANEAGVEALESEREAAFARYYPDREYVEAIGDLR